MTTYGSNSQVSNGAVCELHIDSAASFARSLELTKSLYQADQQAKFLNLQAEADDLLLHLQTLKQQRLSAQSHTQN
jgi:hypothetical protein